jgi:hypothetical protein
MLRSSGLGLSETKDGWPETTQKTPNIAGATCCHLVRTPCADCDIAAANRTWESGSGAYAVATQTLARTTIVDNSDGTTTPVNFLTAPIDLSGWNRIPVIGEVDRDLAGFIRAVAGAGGSIGFGLAVSWAGAPMPHGKRSSGGQITMLANVATAGVPNFSAAFIVCY